MTPTVPVIHVDGVSKKFILHKDKSIKERVINLRRSRELREEFWALQDVSLEIASGTSIGLVGHNGSGKSTLLKVIGGIIQPTAGTVRRRGRMAALLELGAGFHPDLTGKENVYLNAALLGLSRAETDRQFDAIVEFSGIGGFIDTQVKFYSSGMYVRLAFAVAVHVDPDLILVDEVLAVGDEPFQRKCMDKIAEFQSEGRTIVLVSHSSEQVGRLCDRVVVLDKGSIQHDGDPAEGIRILREGYERAAPIANPGSDQSKPVAILDVESAVRRMQDGSHTLDVTVVVESRSVPPHWGVGMSIENTLGMRLWGMTTFAHEKSLPTNPGRHRLSFTFDDVRLGQGKYLVNVGVGDDAGRTFDRRGGATSFDILKAGYGDGILDLTPRIRYDD